MFGLIISGRPVDASPQAITQTQYAFRIPPNPSFNHIVVFILPGVQLPLDTAATVYIQIPPSTEFKLLGAIGPGKESAIFKVTGFKPSSASSADAMVDANNAVTGDIAVGISIEPAAQVEAQLATLASSPAIQQQSSSSAAGQETSLVKFTATSDGRATTKVLAQRIIGNAFNFLASFGSDVVPLKAFQDWWVKFEKKVELDPSFLERAD